MFESYFAKGLLMGIVFGVPAGAIGVLTIRNTLDDGFFSGFLTGMGSSAADLIYAVVCVFGVTLVSDIIQKWQTPLGILGGVLITGLGVMSLISQKTPDAPSSPRLKAAGLFAPAFAIAVMNPATLLSFFIAFAAFKISGKMPPLEGGALVAGIFLGTCLWWAGLSGAVSVLRRRVTDTIYRILNRLLGCLLILLGIALLVNTIMGK